MAALSSYSEKLAPFAPRGLQQTIEQVIDCDPHYTFFGIDPRSELSQLNERYHTLFATFKDSAIGKQLQKYSMEAIDGIGGNPVMIVPAVAGAAGHGIARVQSLSIAVMFYSILQLANDYSSVFNTLANARSTPGFPGFASLFLLSLRDPSMKFRKLTEVIFDPIAATFISAMRPMYVNVNGFRSTICWYYLRDQNQAENVFLGTDALFGTPAVPTSRTTNVNHISGLAGATSAQQLAALQSLITDISAGVGPANILEACLQEYDKFINLMMKHSDFQPIHLNPKEGGIPIRLVNYRTDSSLFTAYSWLALDEMTTDIAELGTMFYKPESYIAAAPAPARRGGYFDIVLQDDLQTSIAARTVGSNDEYWNTGANLNDSSARVQATNIICTLDKRVWENYAFQKKAIPLTCSLPISSEHYAELVRERTALKRKADELYELERRTKLRAEISAESEATVRALALDQPPGEIQK